MRTAIYWLSWGIFVMSLGGLLIHLGVAISELPPRDLLYLLWLVVFIGSVMVIGGRRDP